MLTVTKMFGCAVSENFFIIYNYIISRRVFINNRFRAVYVLIFSLAYPAAFSRGFSAAAMLIPLPSVIA